MDLAGVGAGEKRKENKLPMFAAEGGSVLGRGCFWRAGSSNCLVCLYCGTDGVFMLLGLCFDLPLFPPKNFKLTNGKYYM